MYDLAVELKRNSELREDDINSIKAWMTKQQHLPQISDEMVALFLHTCYYKIEATKNTIENYYTLRTEASEIFSNRITSSAEIEEGLNTAYVLQLPGKTPENYNVVLLKIYRSDPKYFNGDALFKILHMFMDIVHLKIGISPGVMMFIDVDGSSLSHVLKLNINTLRHHFIYLQEAIPVRLKGMHLINTLPFINVFMNMIKPFLSPEVRSLMHLYEIGSEEVYKSIPKSILPKEYGGDAPSLTELQDETRKLLLEKEAWFKEEELLRVDESKRIGKPKRTYNDSGLEGSFRKIEID